MKYRNIVMGLVAGVLAILVWSKALSVSCAMVSAPDDISVLIGSMGLALCGAAVACTAISIVRKVKAWRLRRYAYLVPLLALFMLSGCGTRINAGYAGIKINNYGSSRGVQDIPLVTGWVWYNPFTQSVLEYPCFVQTATWQGEEAFTFNLSGGVIGKADISFSYQFNYEKVPDFWVKFRTDDITKFTHGFLRNVARDAFNEVAPWYTVEDMYGAKKEEMMKQVRDRVNSQLNPVGAHIEQFGFLHALALPPNIADAMNQKAQAIQDAIRVKNELQKTLAEANKVKARADGEAAANLALAKSITPELIQWRNLMILESAVQRWDGHRPSVESGQNAGGMLLQLPQPAGLH